MKQHTSPLISIRKQSLVELKPLTDVANTTGILFTLDMNSTDKQWNKQYINI